MAAGSDGSWPPSGSPPRETGEPSDFVESLLFLPNRDVFSAWLGLAADGVPGFAETCAAVERISRGYAYGWEVADRGEDLVCRHAGPHLRDFLRRPLLGERFSAHAPGPLGREMLANHLACVRAATPFAVLRETHLFPEGGAAYEAIVLPARRAPGEGPADSLVGHLMPFVAGAASKAIAPPGMPVDRGVRLRLPGLSAAADQPPLWAKSQ